MLKRHLLAASLLAIATAAVITLNLFPSVMFPAVSSGRWSIQPSAGARFAAHAGASVAVE